MEIKELALQIKQIKKDKKEEERLFSKIWLDGNYTSRTYWSNPTKYNYIQPHLEAIYKKRKELNILKEKFRLLHIIASMCRGKTISQIENKVSLDGIDRLDRENIYNAAKVILSEMGKKWLQ
jgi:hypothetical protein